MKLFRIYQIKRPMKMLKNLGIILIICMQCNTYAQKSTAIQLGGVIMADTSSTVMIPILYNPKFFSDKMGWGNYYANLIFYNFKTDTSKKLFEKSTYIMSLVDYRYGEKLEKTSI